MLQMVWRLLFVELFLLGMVDGMLLRGLLLLKDGVRIDQLMLALGGGVWVGLMLLLLLVGGLLPMLLVDGRWTAEATGRVMLVVLCWVVAACLWWWPPRGLRKDGPV